MEIEFASAGECGIEALRAAGRLIQYGWWDGVRVGAGGGPSGPGVWEPGVEKARSEDAIGCEGLA